MKQQDGFFRRGVAELRPLTLREVAEQIGMHESTVSRVTSNKYLACARGTFELKYFFTSGVASADGEGASSAAIKARIKALIDAETAKNILSDQQLAEMLQKEASISPGARWRNIASPLVWVRARSEGGRRNSPAFLRQRPQDSAPVQTPGTCKSAPCGV